MYAVCQGESVYCKPTLAVQNILWGNLEEERRLSTLDTCMFSLHFRVCNAQN